MKSQEVKKVMAKLPDSPGVYCFLAPKTKNLEPKILYIGKATSLRDRVRSYFNTDIVTTRSPLISKMLGEFGNIEHIKTDSVLEALVLEANLIKKYQPEANIKEKDNRSFNFVVITNEDFPRVMTVRERELLNHSHFSKTPSLTIYRKRADNNKNFKHLVFNKKESKLYDISYSYVFGPFPSGGQLREAMKIIRKMFPYRDNKCTPCLEQLKKKGLSYDISYDIEKIEKRGKYCKPCFNRQIGLCPGVCTGEISKEEYTKQIDNIILFFEGNKKGLMKNLEKQMKTFSHSQEYENADKVKKTLFTLNHIQDISLIKDPERNSGRERPVSDGAGDFSVFRIESYDIAHLSGTNVVGVMTVVEDGDAKKSDYRKFKIRENPGVNDTKALSEVLSRRLAHIEWPIPDLIVVDGGVAQKRIMEKVLRENKLNIPVVSVVKDEYHRPKQILGDKKWLVYEKEILLSNSEAHRFAISFHKQLRAKLE